ncbi:hypothetical protein F511_27596 [Dorcoceras hygrometricum]|uniref:Uncharacterized protein n=1 Tax=Dorcoceras hygrometricum TaxID=472368 RepID=A0A2Z7C020_9LAMI|nr:hypothetical protein F511_27596 [Dorcoceras hygrometricum]
MSSPDSNFVRRVAESIGCPSPTEASHREDEIPSSIDAHRAWILRIDQDEARLAAQGCTWYEIKASTLRESDISSIKDKQGYLSYMRWFPIPKFITSLCDHIGVSPSQLTPNSFSSLLSLGILLKFYRVSVSTYTLMQLLQIKKLGPWKFYISNKKELGFIGGNPSSHKGWMSRYFFIKHILGRENPWDCDMSWRDNAYTLHPPTPKQRPDLAKILDAMSGKFFNAQELIEEDLLCHFRFSWQKVQLVGDLGERMSKAEMLKSLKERRADPKGTSSSLSKGKRKTTAEGGEKRKKRHHEKKTAEPTREIPSNKRSTLRLSMEWPGSDSPQPSKGVSRGNTGAWLQLESQGDWLFTVGGGRSSISDRNKSDHVEDGERRRPAAALGRADGGVCKRRWGAAVLFTCVTLNGSGIQLAVGPQPLRLRNHNFGFSQRIMVKRLATSHHDPLGITDSACKNQLVVVSVQYGPFNTYIPIRSTTIGKSRVARDPITMHTSWRSNSDIASVTRTNQYNQDLGLIHSTNGNHLESPNEGSSIDHQVTIYLHAQNITMFPTNETLYFASQLLVSSSGGLILILTAQSTRNEFRIHSDY